MGENLLLIKFNTKNDNVRTCLAELQDAGDASAREKYYHRKCLRHAQRTFATEDISAATLIRYAPLCSKHTHCMVASSAVSVF